MNNFIKIEIPEGIQFIGQYPDYQLPKGEHCIVDKGVTGCGYTEMCLTNPDHVILCSPRKLLLENKRDQHVMDRNIVYLDNRSMDGETKPQFQKRLIDHIYKCYSMMAPCKIMVTYDSLPYVVEALTTDGTLTDINKFVFVVDEFQCIFTDAFFKAARELDFVDALQKASSVVYLSATPMLTKYLNRTPEFQNLNYYELDWSKTGYVEKVRLERKRYRNYVDEIGKVIIQYQTGNYPKTFKDGQWYESHEAVFYVNSVTDIVKAVNKYKLTPENTRIICARDTKNANALKRIKFDFGSVPLKDEPKPMFMFCTRSVYVGVDMYSKSAKTFIFANPNIDSMALDIALDLPQIAGRQRDKENMFKNEIVIYYKILSKSKEITLDNFNKAQAARMDATNTMLDTWKGFAPTQQGPWRQTVRDSIAYSQYAHNFVSILEATGDIVYNIYIDLAYQRAWEVIQKDYQDEINLTKAIASSSIAERSNSGLTPEEEAEINQFCFNFRGSFEVKMKVYCEFRDKYLDNINFIESLNNQIGDYRFDRYYSAFGTEGCRAKSYKEIELDRFINNGLKSDQLREILLRTFKLDTFYSTTETRDLLGKIYKELGMTLTPKASELSNYFDMKDAFKKIDGVRVRGFKLTKIK